jgi:hypothetical protein
LSAGLFLLYLTPLIRELTVFRHGVVVRTRVSKEGKKVLLCVFDLKYKNSMAGYFRSWFIALVQLSTTTTAADKTVTRSFRISQSAFDSLKEDAERKKITVNTLVNQLFLAHRDFDRYYERMGLIKIAATTFNLLLEAASEDRVIEAGMQAGADIPRAIIVAKYGVLSLHTVLDFLRMMSEYANLFEYNQVDSEDDRRKMIITLMHRFGRNGSLFLTHYVKTLFEGVGVETKITPSGHSVVIEIQSV